MDSYEGIRESNLDLKTLFVFSVTQQLLCLQNTFSLKTNCCIFSEIIFTDKVFN